MLVDSNTRFHKLHQSKTKQVGEETGSDPVRTSKTRTCGGFICNTLEHNIDKRHLPRDEIEGLSSDADV